MKKYIGTKQVKAEPMNELAAVENGYARKNEDNHEWREGYHVQYINPDGSTYDSWSPKNVFEKAYKCAETFLDRLEIELTELSNKQDKLNKFFDTDIFKSLPKQKQTLLQAQFGAMLAYSQILVERIRLEEE